MKPFTNIIDRHFIADGNITTNTHGQNTDQQLK